MNQILKKGGFMKKMTRREFMVNGSIITGGTLGALTLGGGIFSPSKALSTEIIFPESSCQNKNLNNKNILIAYASAYGSTGGVAEAIGKELCRKGAKVDVFLMKNVKNLSSYQGVVVGSAIYRGKWMPEAVNFVRGHAEILQQVPVAYFMVCMTMRQPTEENRRKALAFLDPVLQTIPQVKPVDIAPFAGAMHYNNLSWLNKTVIQSKGGSEGDFRDWKAIQTWAQGLGSLLLDSRV
jgi:menaquinone-dependent protoporphyrinogen oxidase